MANDYSFLNQSAAPRRTGSNDTSWMNQPQYQTQGGPNMQAENQGNLNPWASPGSTTNQPESGGQGPIFGVGSFQFNQPNPVQQFNPGSYGSATPYNPFGTGSPLGITPPTVSTFTDKNAPYSRYLENWGFPAAQLGQNAYQYANDAAYRNAAFGATFNRDLANDRFQRQMATWQQNSALALQQQAQQNWGQQFGLSQLQNTQQYGLAQQAANLQSQIANQGSWDQQQAAALGLLQANNQNTQFNQQFGLQQQIANQGTWDQQQAAALGLLQANNQNTQFGQQLAQQGQQFNQQFGLQQQIAQGGTWEQRRQAQLQAAQQAQLANQFAQTFGLQQRLGTQGTWEQQQAARLGQQQFGLAQTTQQQQAAFQQQQLAQQAVLERENMLNQQRLASMSAFGRFQAPQARYASSWA